MVRISPQPVAAMLLICLSSGCGGNNIGVLFDPDVGSGPGNTTGVSAVVQGGDALDGRPRVSGAFPTGGGWPTTVPVVVVFNESMNQDQVAPASGDPLVFVQVAGTPGALPASVEFLMGGRVVVIRPLPPLGAGLTYEVVVDPEARDIDGLRFGGAAPAVVASFTTDGDPAEEDGEILTLLPRSNQGNVPREREIYAVFTKPVNTGSVNSGNFRVAPAAGAPVTGTIDFPLGVQLLGSDGRVLRFTPDMPLTGPTDFEVTVDATITFGASGVLDFKGRTPFASFRTLPFEEVVSVAVGNPAVGFPDQINIGNMETLLVDVDIPASAAVNDTVVVRIYGLDPKTTPPDDVNFVEASRRLTVAGAQTLPLNFSGRLGTLAKPVFSDGPVTIAAQLQRGSQHAGFVLSGSGNNPRVDITAPSLTEVGPPMAGMGDIITEQEHLAFYGTASEQIGAASLTDGSSTVNLFASGADGRFVVEPLFLGRRTAPLAYSLNLTDAAGNMSPTALAGNILQRGAVTGTQSGTLTVEAYDEATLQALVGVTVVLDPGVPVKPAVGQLTSTTDAQGRAVFTGLLSPSYTVTLVSGGYHLRTLYDTTAAFVSLPLRPTLSNTASLTGTALYTAAPGTSALVGCNVIDDVLDEEIATSTANPTAVPSTLIRPNRPFVLTAFSGTFEPTGTPTFSFYSCQMCGVDGVTPTPPSAPAAPGAVANQTLALIPAVGALADLPSVYTRDFSLSAGLGTISGTPTVRVRNTLDGFPGQMLLGVGFASGTGPSYTVNGSFSLLSLASLAPYTPVAFVSTEATDGMGNVARNQALLDLSLPAPVELSSGPGIPSLASGGPFTGSPSITYMDRLDPGAVAAGLGFAITEITATDNGGNGRSWALMIEDTNSAVGATAIQFPDLSGIGVPGLGTGVWSIRAEDYLYLSTSFGAADFLHEERFRQQATYARAQAVSFVVN